MQYTTNACYNAYKIPISAHAASPAHQYTDNGEPSDSKDKAAVIRSSNDGICSTSPPSFAV